MLEPNPQCDGIWRWGLWGCLGHESEALMNRINALVEEIPESSLTPSTMPFGKMVIYGPRKRLPLDTESAGTWIMN